MMMMILMLPQLPGVQHARAEIMVGQGILFKRACLNLGLIMRSPSPERRESQEGNVAGISYCSLYPIIKELPLYKCLTDTLT